MANVRNATKIVAIAVSTNNGVITSVNTRINGDPFKTVKVKASEGRASDSLGMTASCFVQVSKMLKEEDHALIFVPDNQVRRINEARRYATDILNTVATIDEGCDADAIIESAANTARDGIIKPWMSAEQQNSAVDLLDAWQNIFASGADINVRGYMESYGYAVKDLGAMQDIDIDSLISKESERLMIGDSGIVGGFYTGIKLNLMDGVDQETGAEVNSNFLNGERELCVRFSGTGDRRKAEFFVPMQNLTNASGNQTPNGILVDYLWGWNDADGVHHDGLLDTCKKNLPRLQSARVARRA